MVLEIFCRTGPRQCWLTFDFVTCWTVSTKGTTKGGSACPQSLRSKRCRRAYGMKKKGKK